MRKSLLMVVFALIGTTAFAQKDSGFGIKAGLNYNQNGDLSFKQVQSASEDLIAGSDGKVEVVDIEEMKMNNPPKTYTPT